jgi:Protein of unknown function DUF2617
MLSTITAAYADTSAAQLRLEFGLPRLDAYAQLALPLSHGELDLRLLGQSHQVVMEGDGISCSETVACLDGPAGLPCRAELPLAGAAYRFTSQVRVLGPAALEAEARALVETYADQAAALVGVFPGSPSAVTAVAVRPLPHGVGWRTWHVYPQTGEVVETSSRILWRQEDDTTVPYMTR